MVLSRRKFEDAVHVGIWVLFSLSLIVNAYRGLGNQIMYFSYTSAGLLLVSFEIGRAHV